MFLLLEQLGSAVGVDRYLTVAAEQIKACARTQGKLKRHSAPDVTTLVKKSKDKKAPPDLVREVNEITYDEGTRSLNMKPGSKGFEVHNSATEDMKGFEKSPEVVEGAKSKNPALKKYYGKTGPATGYITIGRGLADIATVFHGGEKGGKTRKELEKTAKTWAPKMIAALEGLEKNGYVTPGDQRFANAVGLIKGTYEGLDLKGSIDPKMQQRLDTLVKKATDDYKVGTVVTKTANEIVEQYKKSEGKPAGGEGLQGPPAPGMPPIPQPAPGP